MERNDNRHQSSSVEESFGARRLDTKEEWDLKFVFYSYLFNSQTLAYPIRFQNKLGV